MDAGMEYKKSPAQIAGWGFVVLGTILILFDLWADARGVIGGLGVRDMDPYYRLVVKLPFFCVAASFPIVQLAFWVKMEFGFPLDTSADKIPWFLIYFGISNLLDITFSLLTFFQGKIKPPWPGENALFWLMALIISFLAEKFLVWGAELLNRTGREESYSGGGEEGEWARTRGGGEGFGMG